MNGSHRDGCCSAWTFPCRCHLTHKRQCPVVVYNGDSDWQGLNPSYFTYILVDVHILNLFLFQFPCLSTMGKMMMVPALQAFTSVNTGKSFKWYQSNVKPLAISAIMVTDFLHPLAVVSAT